MVVAAAAAACFSVAATAVGLVGIAAFGLWCCMRHSACLCILSIKEGWLLALPIQVRGQYYHNCALYSFMRLSVSSRYLTRCKSVTLREAMGHALQVAVEAEFGVDFHSQDVVESWIARVFLPNLSWLSSSLGPYL